jgi:MinD-like ATPase involved in chromosome partitioning or flagellar assembly
VALREACDQGRPVVADRPESASARAFLSIAEQVSAALQDAAPKPPPRIIIEE